MSWVNVPPAEWPIRIGGRSSPRITSVRWSMTAGHGQVLDRGRVGVHGLDLDLETRVGRGEHAVALLLVVGLQFSQLRGVTQKPWIRTMVSGFIGSLRAPRVERAGRRRAAPWGCHDAIRCVPGRSAP